MVDEPLQIKNLDIENVLKKIDKILKEEIHELDLLLEEKITKEKNIPAMTSNFAREVADRIFGKGSGEIIKDYNKLIHEITRGGSREKEIRKYYLEILGKKFKYDPHTGDNNLIELSGELIEATNKWIKELKDSKFFEGGGYYDKIESEDRFIRALLFGLLMFIMSGVSLKRVAAGKIKKAEEIIKTITKIYYGRTLSYEQFNNLKKMGLDGGILFRGINFKDIKQTKEFVGSKVTKRGSGWTTNWDIAKGFAIDAPDQHEFNDSLFKTKTINFRQFKKEINEFYKKGEFSKSKDYLLHLPDYRNKRKIFIFVDKLKDLKKISHLISECIEKENKQLFKLEFGYCAIILSYLLINKKTKEKFSDVQLLNYLGGAHEENFGEVKLSFGKEEEVVILPEKVDLKDFSIDAVIMLRTDKLF